MDIKPIFLVKGPAGCGKSDLIKITADTIGNIKFKVFSLSMTMLLFKTI